MEEKIKTSYCPEAIKIITEVEIEELLKECQRIRINSGLKETSKINIIILALKMYKRKRERILKNKEVENGKK